MTTMLILLAVLLPVNGTVRDAQGEPLPGVTVFIKGTQTSVVTGADGTFAITPETSPATLVAYLGGFQPKEVMVLPGAEIDVRLELAVAESVTVTAAADRDVPMSTYVRRPLDIVRTPGAQGDVFRALQTIPGVARADDGAGLFVRGGDVSEVRVLLDGTTIAHPYRYETPSGGQAGAVEPFLLEGIAFSTGGFSARHGNALSAIVDLRGMGRPSSSSLTATLGLAGASARVAIPGGADSGMRASGNLRFPRLLFAVNGAPREFDRYPEGWDLNTSFHHDSPRLGTLKLFVMEQRTAVGVRIERESFDGFLHAESEHGVVAASWKNYLGGWQMSSSLGADRYSNRTDVGVLDLRNEDLRLSWRLDASRLLGSFIVRAGVDADRARHDITGRTSVRGGDYGGVSGSRGFDVGYRDWHAGVHVEGERTFGRFTPTLGVRVDQSQRSGAWIDPRLNVTVALRKNEQLRLAWGIYHQAPSSAYFERTDALKPMRAVHWIAGYEYGNPETPLHARIELYRKTYSDLPLETVASSGLRVPSASRRDALATRNSQPATRFASSGLRVPSASRRDAPATRNSQPATRFTGSGLRVAGASGRDAPATRNSQPATPFTGSGLRVPSASGRDAPATRNSQPATLFTSDGYGSAQGIDVYVNRQWTKFGVRASYAYVDARRRWTPHEQRQRFAIPDGTWRPDFWIPHSATVVATFNPTPRIAVGTALSAASGRPTTPITGAVETPHGFMPVYGPINSDRLPRYERVDLSSSYRRRSLIYILGITNVLARRNSFEYAYSRDYSEKRPVVSAAPRSVYVAVSWTRQ